MEITEMRGIEPDAFHRKGDPNTSISKKGKMIEHSPYSSGLWSINSTVTEDALIEDHIKSLILLLEPSSGKLEELQKRGYRMDLFCGLFAQGCHQPGLEIGANTLKRAGDLNLKIGICFYN